ncbi:MAG: ATPase domain-containing protein [Methanobacteriota archaeon]
MSSERTIKRKSLGVPGLDDMIVGGVPSPCALLVAGEPGTGKTTLCVQSMFSAAKNGEKALYITAISEPQWVVQKFLSGFVFYDQALVESEKVIFVDLGKELISNPSAILGKITELVERHMPDRLVIDPITPITDMLHWRGETREFMHELFAKLKAYDCITLITAEMNYEDISKKMEAYMVDGVLMLSYPEEDKVRRKFLEVLKMRGTRHVTGRQLVEIGPEGFAVQPGLR